MRNRLNRRRFLALSAGTAVVASGFTDIPASAQAAVSTAIVLDGHASGRLFDGIGAISGGGGNSRLLIDYPEPYRSQILDYLFKPNYGANLHILKVEVGGDTNSTDGAEASFMHTATEQNFNRGYEWWLMCEAKRRNPQIKLYGLAWGAPGWIGTTDKPVFDTNNRFWSQDMVDYYIAWIKGAKRHYDLTIDYIGGWNERGYNKQFYEALHTAIQANGFSTKIVGADSGWEIADDMVSDATFKSAVDIVGVHYPCTGGDGGSATSCPNTANAKSLGKPLWASENGSQDQNSGAVAMARAINRGYIDGLMTAYINWPLIAAIYPNLPYATVGLMVANQPWSGYYSVGKQTWVTAHTTQFTRPGWQYIDSACGYLGGSDANGSYVTLKAPGHGDYSVVIETVDATASQTVSFQVDAGLSTGTVHVWATNLSSTSASDYFVQQASVMPADGTYSVTLQPGYIYTLTTTKGQGKGTIAGPPRASLALPYVSNFAESEISSSPLYFSDMNGAFEIVASRDRHRRRVLRQMAPVAPINWDNPSDPYTLLGDLSWTDYTVSSDVLLEQAGYAALLGRVGTQQGFSPANINAYYLRVDNDGAWSIRKNSLNGTVTTLLSGSVTAPGLNTWHTLTLDFQGSTITAHIDGSVVGSVTDSDYTTGQVGLGSGWQNVQFDNFSVTTTQTTVVSSYYKIVNRNSGKLLDVAGGATTAGSLIVQSSDSGATSQHWQLVATGGYLRLINRNSGDVLDVQGRAAERGAHLDQASRDEDQEQQWQFRDAGGGYYSLINRRSELAVTVAGASTADGAEVVLWSGARGANQQWRLVPVPTPGVVYELFNRETGKVLDVSGESTSDGGVVIQWPDHGGNNQQWRLVDVGGGYYTLINFKSGKALEVPAFSTTPGVQLDQWGSNGGTNQQWQLVDVGGGYYTLVNRNSGLVVSIASVDTIPVVQASSTSGPDQQWQFSLVF